MRLPKHLTDAVQFFRSSVRRGLLPVIEAVTAPRNTVLWGERIRRRNGPRSQKPCRDIQCAQRLLVIRDDEIGDLVLLTPFLRELRRNVPKAWITLVVKTGTRNLVELCPYVDEILAYDNRAVGPAGSAKQFRYAFGFAGKHLWKRRFDTAIVLRWDSDQSYATFLAYFSGAAQRIGYTELVSSTKRAANRGCDLLLTQKVSTSSHHESQRNLDILRAAGGSVQNAALEVWLSRADRNYADTVLLKNSVGEGKIAAFGVGASADRKIWPVENFIRLGRFLLEDGYSHLVVVGDKNDQRLGQCLQSELGPRVINVAGETTLRQAAAILERCSLFIGNDSGPMHLAAAVNVPVIEITGYSQQGASTNQYSPARFGPLSPASIALQPLLPSAPCVEACESDEAHCIKGITVESVIEATGRIGETLGRLNSAGKPRTQEDPTR